MNKQLQLVGEGVNIVIGEAGKVVFRVGAENDKELVFSVHGNSLGETVYSTPRANGAYIPVKGTEADIYKIAKPLAPRTARRHVKALVEGVKLKQLA